MPIDGCQLTFGFYSEPYLTQSTYEEVDEALSESGSPDCRRRKAFVPRTRADVSTIGGLVRPRGKVEREKGY